MRLLQLEWHYLAMRTAMSAPIYRGPLRVPLSVVIPCALCSLVLIGIPVFLYYWLQAKRSLLTITEQELRIESGIVLRTVEVYELSRVRDLALASALGFETITLHGSDARTPTIALCFAGAGAVFDRLREVVRAARSGVVVTERA